MKVLTCLLLSIFLMAPSLSKANSANHTSIIKLSENANDNNNRRTFYVKVTEEQDKVFKLLVKGTKIEPIDVKIYDNSKNLLAEDHIDTNKSFTKIYNLSGVKSKKIVFEIINREDLIAKEEFKK